MKILTEYLYPGWRAYDEFWKSVIGHEGFYEISDAGRVRSLDRVVKCGPGAIRERVSRGRILAPRANRSGHLQVILSAHGIQSMRYVHHLVLEAFIGPRPSGHQACHYPDRDPANNSAENLRWGTVRDNAADRVVHGSQSGERSANAKLTAACVSAIKSLTAQGMSRADIARRFGVTKSAIGHIRGGRSWRHVE